MIPDWYALIGIVFATWRLATMFTAEDGPFNIFRRIRSLFGITHYDDGVIANIPDKTLAKLFTCLWCMSVWCSGIIYIIWYFQPIPVWILAISGGAILLESFIRRLDNGTSSPESRSEHE